MSTFFDYSLFEREITFAEIEVGQKFPPFNFRLTPEHLDVYRRSVDETESAAVPSLAAFNFGFLYSAMGRRLPKHFLNSGLGYEFFQPIEPGTALVMTVSVASKEIKRERKHAVLRVDVHDEAGAALCSANIAGIYGE